MARTSRTAGTSLRPIDPVQTLDLRRRILGAGPEAQDGDLVFSGDDDPTTGHVGAFANDDGGLIGVGTIMLDALPPIADQTWRADRSWRIRGMAVDDGRRSGGIGGAVLGALLEHANDHGSDGIWCNARTPAMQFYERHGFVVAGDEFVIPQAGPHYVMWMGSGS